MKNHKRLLRTWLHGFIAVVCDLSDTDFQLSVYSGYANLHIPPDIFSALKQRRMFEIATDSRFCFFRFNHDGGDVLIRAISDDSLKHGLILKIIE